jgi:ribonuclease E
MSVIIRTAGVNKNAKELQWDLDTLLAYFEALKLAATMDRAAPYLIHQESNVLIRTLRDYMRADIDEVILDNKACFDQAHAYMKQARPELLERIKYYEDSTPLFSRYQIEKQIESSLSREVRLPSGGSIIIDQTEALVAIDVNSARATRGRSIEETASNTNLEAAKEIARQLRLRDLGGLIIVDFIDMTQFKHQREVEEAFKDAVASDRARIQFARISRFGLLEMSRQRLRSGTNKNITNPCPRCDGTGMVRSIESLSRTIVHLLEEQAAAQSNQSFQINAPITVATHLANEHRQAIRKIEEGFNCHITILPREDLVTPHYDIKSSKFDADEQILTPSYKHLKGEATPPIHAHIPSQSQEQPRIEQFLKAQEDKAPAENTDSGLFKFIKNIFSSKNSASSKTEKNQNTETKTTNTSKREPSEKRISSRKNATQENNRRAPTQRSQKPLTADTPTIKPTKKSDPRPIPSSDKKVTQIPQEMNDLVLENDLAFDPKALSRVEKPLPQPKKNLKPKVSRQAPAPNQEALTILPEKMQEPIANKPEVKLPLQSNVIQRPMKAGIRISPKSEAPQNNSLLTQETKISFAPGRKILDAPISEKIEHEQIFKPAQNYPAGRKISDANQVKVNE